MNNKSALIVFCKEPKPGHVKTRLARSFLDSHLSSSVEESHELALDCYRFFCSQIQKKLIQFQSLFKELDVFICFDSENNHPPILNQVFENHKFIRQSKGNLGQRMKSAFSSLFKLSYQKVICIGTDSPDLEIAELIEGFHRLDLIDSVIGPCEDGGYYFIGIKNNQHQNDTLLNTAMNNINWSTSEVLKQTELNFTQSEFSLEILNVWYDIDSLEDLKRYIKIFTPMDLPFLPKGIW